MMPRRRRGFTLIEMLMVVTIIAILAAVAVPKYRALRRQAMATRLIGDFDVLRNAALSFYADSGYFPQRERDASIPFSLRSYLPNGFAMEKPEWAMRYALWPAVPIGASGTTVGITFTTSDPALGMTAMRLSGNRPGFVLGSRYTFLVAY